MRFTGAFWLTWPVIASGYGFSIAQAATVADTELESRHHHRHHHHHNDSGGGDDTRGGDAGGGDSGGGDESGGNTATLATLAGIWVADGNEPTKLDAGCTLMMRVTAEPPQLVRAIICANGNLQTETAPIYAIGVEPSRFPGGFQLRTKLGEGASSCGYGAASIFAPLASIAFDLKTAAGGEPATIAYTQFGDLEVALHSGGAIDAFNRNKECGSLTKLAKDLPDTADNQLVKLAAKVCGVEALPAGCFTADGYTAGGMR